jgi:hypothetical protein
MTRTIGERKGPSARPALHNRRVAEGPTDDHHRNPIYNAPLFPLLPSVQIFFCSLC